MTNENNKRTYDSSLSQYFSQITIETLKENVKKITEANPDDQIKTLTCSECIEILNESDNIYQENDSSDIKFYCFNCKNETHNINKKHFKFLKMFMKHYNCPLCKNLVELSSIKLHFQNCSGRIIICVGCKSLFNKNDFTDHYTKCTSLWQDCIYCNKPFLEPHVIYHQDEECELRFTQCVDCLLKYRIDTSHTKDDCINELKKQNYKASIKPTLDLTNDHNIYDIATSNFKSNRNTNNYIKKERYLIHKNEKEQSDFTNIELKKNDILKIRLNKEDDRQKVIFSLDREVDFENFSLYYMVEEGNNQINLDILLNENNIIQIYEDGDDEKIKELKIEIDLLMDEFYLKVSSNEYKLCIVN